MKNKKSKSFENYLSDLEFIRQLDIAQKEARDGAKFFQENMRKFGRV